MANEDELITDLKFLYHNRNETLDQFMDEALALFTTHLNNHLAEYQERTLEEATQYFKGEMATVLLKTHRQYRKDRQKQPAEGSVHDW